jgi:RNA polymerase sigma factor (sigma-70 family)
MLPSIDAPSPPSGNAPDDHSVDDSFELVARARRGERPAVDALMQRHLPPLRRWAHGRLPPTTRGQLDTCDLVQDVALHALGRLASFEPRHPAALDAYLRRALMNRIRDELRRVARRPRAAILPEDLAANGPSPLAAAIEAQQYWRYRQALSCLGAKDRQLIVARVEHGWSHRMIAEHFGLPSVPAASMAVLRAARRLASAIDRQGDQARGSSAGVRFCSDGR